VKKRERDGIKRGERVCVCELKGGGDVKKGEESGKIARGG
jgi:hypothetical protein